MWIAKRALRLVRGPVRSPEALRREYLGRAPPTPAPITRDVRRACAITIEDVLGRRVFTLTPKTRASGWHILYTHGGSFVNELVAAHWRMIACLVRETGAAVTVPSYPLAPEHDYRATFALLDEVYRSIRARSDRVVLCGDSAGGNLALVQAMRHRDLGMPPAAQVVLFAPWLDLTLADPAIAALEREDVMLRREELVEQGRWWAGGDDPRAPHLSPLYGSFDRLPPIRVYQGTADILLPDARRLRGLGADVRLYETAGGFHVFMGATFTREARAVFRRIGEELR